MRTTSSSPAVRPAATFQHVLRPMEAAAARRKRLVPAADQAWQGASPLQRRLAVATATTLRRPPHPLRRTGAAQHHLSPMRASSAKRHNAGGERARARRKAAWFRCRKASGLAPPAWLLANILKHEALCVVSVAAFPLYKFFIAYNRTLKRRERENAKSEKKQKKWQRTSGRQFV